MQRLPNTRQTVTRPERRQSTLPHADDSPIGRAQRAGNGTVALCIPGELWDPVILSRGRQPAMARTAMPKTPVDEHGDFVRRKYKIWLPGKLHSASPSGNVVLTK